MSEIITIDEHTTLEGDFHFESPTTLNYRFQDQNYSLKIRETENPKLLEVHVNGNIHRVMIQTEIDVLITKMGLNVLDKKDAGDIFSPMPGLVIDLLINQGDIVEEGQPLMVLEAMKMENIIKASGKGIIQDIKVAKGEKIEKSQLLITITPVE